MAIEGIRRIDSTKIEVPQDYRKGMRVKGIIYVDENLEKELEVQSIAQVANVASLPGIVKASLAMPDIHTGYGFAIGGVAAFNMKEGIISPGGVGYDIN
jgi:tRNA-splicing ligase RtcB (3'-phosphate/5'-hydroxy nucleic acid ligase)